MVTTRPALASPKLALSRRPVAPVSQREHVDLTARKLVFPGGAREAVATA